MKKRATVNSRVLGKPANPHLQGPPAQVGVDGRREYRSPRLQCFGDIRTLTLGGSPGFSDSSVEPQNMLM